MDQKIIVEYSKLISEFAKIDEGHKKRIIEALKKMVGLEEYRYLKYLQLDRMLLNNRLLLRSGINEEMRKITIGKVIYGMSSYDLAEQLIEAAEQPEKKEKKSFFR